MGLIFFVITLIVFVIWLIVGFIMWIPMLVRGIAVYSASLTYAATVNASPSYMKRRDEDLKRVANFYMDGFSRVFQMYQNRNQEYDEGKDRYRNERMRIGPFLLELFWTVLFWAGVLFLFAPDFLSSISNPY